MTELSAIIKLHEKLIYKIASKFHDIDQEDLFQSGVIGLIKAYNNYHETKETKFTTYAYNYIFGEMYEFAKMRGLEIDPAEEKYHALLHQRVSKIIAQEEFGITDSDILNAIECHTTLRKNASLYDKIIFIADKISWDQKGVPPYYDFLNDFTKKKTKEETTPSQSSKGIIKKGRINR